MTKFLIFVATLMAILFFESWALMVFIGILHGSLTPAIPAVGYDSAFKISLGVEIVGIPVLVGKGIGALFK